MPHKVPAVAIDGVVGLVTVKLSVQAPMTGDVETVVTKLSKSNLKYIKYFANINLLWFCFNHLLLNTLNIVCFNKCTIQVFTVINLLL